MLVRRGGHAYDAPNAMGTVALPPDDEQDAALWDALPGWVLLLTATGDALYANSALCNFAGRTPAQLVGRGWLTLLTPGSLDTLLDRLATPHDFELDLDLLDSAGGELRVRCAARWN